MSDSEFSSTPPEVREIAKEASNNLLPKKSKERYESAYTKFVNWCENKKIKNYSENVLLAYFKEFPHKKSLWSTYSMLKSCILINHNINIAKFSKLFTFLKRETVDLKPKKSRVLEENQVNKFLNDAPDNTFLFMKVALIIIGVSGACRREELCKMMMNHIEFKLDIVAVSIPDCKTKNSRSFVIIQSDWIDLLKKYVNIRGRCQPKDKRLFYTYRNGQCVNVPVGLNTIGKVPSRIAAYLKLENPNEFTGHCFRRSSATMPANNGGDLVSVKRHGGWKSSAVAEGYIEESLQSRIAIAQKLTEAGPSCSSTCTRESAAINVHVPQESFSQSIQRNEVVPGVSISNCHSCTININIHNTSSNTSENN